MSTSQDEVFATAPEDETELNRVLGPKLLLLFIVGDILGAGIYAVTGTMAAGVGGIVWLPFLLAFLVASLTALSYLELVTKYPQAAGAALYTHKAFGIHLVTFIVAFAVICSGITSASTSAVTLAQNFFGGMAVNGIWSETVDGAVVTTVPDGMVTLVAIAFMVLLALINLRGVGESVKFNVFLTLVEMGALAIVIGVGFYAMSKGSTGVGELVAFDDYHDKGMFMAVTVATSVAFFAMVGFEDSVNMVEETQDPERVFPRTMLTGLGIAVIVYMLVAVSVVMVIPPGELKAIGDAEGRALLDVVSRGAPDFPIDKVFPFLACFAVANTALINMLMASRLLYGMSKQGVLPSPLGKVLPGARTPWVGILFSTLMALGLLWWVSSDPESNVVKNLSGTTALLLLGVFAVVNVACMILRKDPPAPGRRPFRSPGVTPLLAAFLCLFLVIVPAAERDSIQYQIAGGMLLVGVVLWAVTLVFNKLDRREVGEYTGEE
ncbi:amino acid permease [Nocardioides sp. Soil797]|nr:amino acid permease [Nocardioides sp. Soil797]